MSSPADTRPSAPSSRSAPRGHVALGVAIALGAALVLAVVAAQGARTYAAASLPYPGFGAAAAYAVLRLSAAIAGSFVLGSLVYTLFCTKPGKSGRVDVDGYAGIRAAEPAAVVWALSSLLLIPVSAADAAGTTMSTMLRHKAFGTLVDAAERPKAWIVVALLTLVLAVLLRFTLSWNGLFGLAALAAVAVIAPACVGNAAEGPNHDYGTGAVILFTLALSLLAGSSWQLAGHARRARADAAAAAAFPPALRRYRMTVGLAVAVMAPTALILALILSPPSRATGVYAALACGCAAALTAFAALATWLRRTSSHPDHASAPAAAGADAWSGCRRALVGATVVAVAWLAASVAMAIQPAPAFADSTFTAQEALLGFDLPDPPSVGRMFAVWRFDLVLGTAAIALAVLYLLGAFRLRRRGDAWSPWRTLSWVSGCVGLLIVTSSGVATYGYAMFSVHMGIHMALNMFVPVLLVLGAPVTLLLRAVEPAGRDGLPGPREWVNSLMHSRFTGLLSNAVVALAVFVVSLYGLYFSSLFDHLIRFHWGHLLMNVHFLLTGYLFYWAIIGVDPGPKRLPHLGRLGMLFAVMPFHAFFGVAVMSMDTVIGSRFYSQLYLGWLHDLRADQHLGGGLAWISGEVPVLLVVGALLSQWAKQDRKVATRTERHQRNHADDDELAAYNAMLAELARTRR